MLKEFRKICSAINTFSRKDDKRMTQSIESHMSNYNIEIYSEDTIDKIAIKFDIKLIIICFSILASKNRFTSIPPL